MQQTTCDISVVIPLYNKASDIYLTLTSVLVQSVRPREVIVVDDGSTDGSAEIVERMIANEPHVRLVRQANAGVSAARNRAIEMAQGEWVALLDGDDLWSPDYLKAVQMMIERWPECGAIGTGFFVEDRFRRIVGSTPEKTGKVDFFEESMRRYVLIPSATTLRRDLVLRLGGFPEGMRMGEDQYLWTKIAREAEVVFYAHPMIIYQRSAANSSFSLYRPEQSKYSLEDLYDESASAISNEYVARVALGKALVESARGGRKQARRALEFFAYNTMSKRIERKVRVLNSLPRILRPLVLYLYNNLAWLLAGKGM